MVSSVDLVHLEQRAGLRLYVTVTIPYLDSLVLRP